MKIINCKVSHLRNPIGYALNEPLFSWNITDTSEPVKASRLLIRNDTETVYDSGWTQLDFMGVKPPFVLEPRTSYYWTVSVRSEKETITSEENYFETGKRDETWSAKWISCDMREERHPIFFRDITVSKPVRKARLYICGLGLYEAYYNGEKISDGYLTPFCNDYDQWLQAQTYDVSEVLKESGRLEIWLGQGWYLGRFGFRPQSAFRYGKEYALIAELHLAYEDETEEVINTDDSWLLRRSHITFSNIYDGEHVDDTLEELPEEHCILLDKDQTPSDSYSLPVKAHEEFEPELIVSEKGEYIFDLKQNIAGIFTFRVHEPKGTVIRLQAGEVLQKGCFYRDNLRSAKAEYVYVSDGEEHILRPKFTFYGYRYMKVEGVREVKAEDFKGIALYSDFETVSSLKTGNAKINQLISNSRWGMKDNFVDVPTDCPQRDERMGWTGDAQVFSATAMYFADTYAFYRKYLHDMAIEQKRFGGQVPHVIPAFDLAGGNPMGASASVWGDATTIIPWNMYRFSGDISILKEHYEAMKSWVDYIEKLDGEDHNWRKVFHFGDWLALDGENKPDAVMGGTDEGFIADVYYRRSARIVSESAKLLGYAEEAEKYQALADRIEKGLLEEYYSPNGRCAIMTQTGQILSVQNQLGSKEKAATVLTTLLENNGRKLKTGFVGTPLLCLTLSDIDRDDLAYALLFNEEYPGWLYEVNLGATTIWERWNSLGPDGLISSTGMNSLNHYSYGSIVQWIFERCAGLKAIEAGFRKSLIAPMPHKDLKEVEMSFLSQSGEWKISWKIEGRKHLYLSVEVPYGCEAELLLPSWDKTVSDNPVFEDCTEGICHLKAGSYSVDYEMTSLLGLLSVNSRVKDLMMNETVMRMIQEKLPQLSHTVLRSISTQCFAEAARYFGADEAFLKEIDEEIAEITGG